MRGLFSLVAAGLLVISLSSQPVAAAAGNKDKAKPKPQAQARTTKQQDAAAKRRQALVAEVNEMRNQEVRVAILQQLLTEEVTKMRDIQNKFCKEHRLDADKFRRGLYRYDEQEDKFVEVKPQPPVGK